MKKRFIRKVVLKKGDNSRGDVSLSKFLNIFKLLNPKNTKQFASFNEFQDIHPRFLKENKIKGLIIDCDETISYNEGIIIQKNYRHLLKLLKAGIKIVIFSNMQLSNRYDILPKSIKIITNVEGKPAKQGFTKSLKTLALKKSNVAMVGDNIMTDGAAVQYGIKFIKIKAIKTKNESLFKKFKRLPETILRTYGELVFKIHKKLGK